jgi:hypothetical protein
VGVWVQEQKAAAIQLVADNALTSFIVIQVRACVRV